MRTSSTPVRSSFRIPRELAGCVINFVPCVWHSPSQNHLQAPNESGQDIGTELNGVMARTERLTATPNRDGMLHELDIAVAMKPLDLRAYRRLGDPAEAVDHHEPMEYWKSAPYLINFMERYKLKEAVVQSAVDGHLNEGEELDPGPGLLNWDDVEAYKRVDPQNARLRWLLDDLEHHHAFELLWIPPSMRYYDTGTVYETPEAARFTERLIFSGWTVVPKVVPSLVSFEAERRAFAGRGHELHSGLPATWWPASCLPYERAHNRPGPTWRGVRRPPSGGYDHVSPELAEPQPRHARRSPTVGARRLPPRV